MRPKLTTKTAGLSGREIDLLANWERARRRAIRMDDVRDAVVRELPPTVDAFRRAFLYLSNHGSATCTEADPHCPVCPLLKDCPEGKARTLHD